MSVTHWNDVIKMIERHFGNRCRVLSIDSESDQVTFSLYDSFVFAAGIDAQTRIFGMALLLPGGQSTKHLLGRTFSLNNDDKSIRASFTLADEYCRLRLPDKFLEAYEATLEQAQSR